MSCPVLTYAEQSLIWKLLKKEREYKDMENIISQKDELIRIDDMINTLESKISNISGLLELISAGTQNINKTGDTYELDSINVLKDYLSMISKTDIPKLHDMLRQLIDNE